MSADADGTRTRVVRRLEPMAAMWALTPHPARGGQEVLTLGERRGTVIFGDGWVWFAREGAAKGTRYGVPQHRRANAVLRELARELVDPEGIARELAEEAQRRAEDRAAWEAAAEARRLVRKAEQAAADARERAVEARRAEAQESFDSTLRLLGVAHDLRARAEPFGPGGMELTFRSVSAEDARKLVQLAIAEGILRPSFPRGRV